MSDNGNGIGDLERIEVLEDHIQSYNKQLRGKARKTPDEISAFVKLNNTLDRSKERIGLRKSTKDEVCPDVYQMSASEFLTLLENGQLDRWRDESADAGFGDPFHGREVALEESDYLEWEATKKPKLFLPAGDFLRDESL